MPSNFRFGKERRLQQRAAGAARVPLLSVGGGLTVLYARRRVERFVALLGRVEFSLAKVA